MGVWTVRACVNGMFEGEEDLAPLKADSDSGDDIRKPRRASQAVTQLTELGWSVCRVTIQLRTPQSDTGAQGQELRNRQKLTN